MRLIRNHTDDIFKKAAEDYPLNTSSKNWNALQEKMKTQEPAAPVSPLGKGRSPFIFFIAASLLLCIPIAIKITGFAVSSKIPPVIAFNNTTVEKATLAVNARQKENIQNSTEEKNAQLSVTDNNLMASEAAPLPASAGFKNYSIIRREAINALPAVPAELSHRSTNTVAAGTWKSAPGNETTKNSKYRPLKSDAGNNRKFYIGGVVAPELTRVKGQQFSKPGYNIGLVTGYRFNDHWQAEMGIVLAHKYYFTDGKYAAPKSLRKDNATIESISAFNSITEVPISLKYRFNAADKSSFFVSAGTVSYFIHKQTYNYVFTKNGREKEGYKRDFKSLDNLVSDIQVSAGYEQKIGKFTRLYIEPYYRTPLNGIGISNLPVTGMGINFAFVKYIR